MSTQSDAVSQIISAPQGGGALQGIGEKFSPDLFTGTGNFTVPIALPPGRNGFQPQLSLVYSTGNGNGPFGLGWSLSVPGVARKTSKGIPQYDDSKDVFILSGSEDLVPISSSAGPTVYRPRTEVLFARITHYRDPRNDYWEVRSKDGLVSVYGTPGEVSMDPAVILDPAALADPENSSHVFAWKLSLTTDPFGNRIEYAYIRDSRSVGPHTWDQLYLSEIRYVDYGNPNAPQFLAKIRFTYDGPIWRPGNLPLSPNQRLDSFSDYRAGFEIRTVKRCTQIDVLTEPGIEKLVRSYHLLYRDQLGSAPPNGASLLAEIFVQGCDETNSELLPPLEFAYSEFKPAQQKFIVLKGEDLPPQSLGDPSTDLVDIFGQGLPDVLEMNGTARYWRNRGNGTFDIPRPMRYAPAGVGLADPGVQILDANGDGRPDLLVTTPNLDGYYPLCFGGEWDTRSFQWYSKAPSFNLKDPNVRLLDLDGDGVTDAIRSGTSFECYFNDPQKGWNSTRLVPRKNQLSDFPDVDFSDPRVKWADMTGDGLQDIVLVYDGVVQYWPNLGYGNWGERVTMVDELSQPNSRPHFPWGYDPKRILLRDVDGDGSADLVYIDDVRVSLWLNQTGNRWSQPIVIEGTPPISDADSIRLADIQGNGVTGILWTSNLMEVGRPHMFFLDLTGGVKPYLLTQMNNHMGSVTTVTYKPSTWFYLQDEQKPDARWITPLPFPVQVVASVETTDQFSNGKLTTEYSYHHGYWDGYEREFRGFGRVDHRDTEVISPSPGSPPQYFTPPTEVRTWFHQGAIGDRFEGWGESDSAPVLSAQNRFTDEYYQEPWPGVSPNAQVLSRPAAMKQYISSFSPEVQRDLFRSMRGKILRTELYALDGTARTGAPYTVTEHVYGVREESPPAAIDPERLHVFFPFTLAQRTTQWERGTDPLSTFTFTDDCTLVCHSIQTADYDPYGQPLSQISVGVARGRIFQLPTSPSPENSYLVTQTETTYAQRDDELYIIDRVSSATMWEILNDGSAPIFSGDHVKNGQCDLIGQIQSGSVPRNIVSQNLSFFANRGSDNPGEYDGDEYSALPFGQIGSYGTPCRSETLVFTNAAVQSAYGANLPPYLSPNGTPNWTTDYPKEFRDLLPPMAGYTYRSGGTAPYLQGYYRITEQHKYDFQETPLVSSRGLPTGKKDAFGNETTVAYDTPYQFLPIKVTNAAGLITQATYDYRVLQPNLVTDPNGNKTTYTFSPLGLLQQILVMGQPGQNLGDSSTAPGTEFIYTLMEVNASGVLIPVADLGQPVSVRTVRREHHASETDVPEPERDQTIQTIEFSDGFGRVLQTRTQAEDVLFGPVFGDAGLPAVQSQPGQDAVGQQSAASYPFVIVSGWQIYDNKGQMVEKHEPFFSNGWDYAEPEEAELGQKETLYYDALGRVIRTVNPDGSEQRVIYGVPGTIASPDLTNPDVFEPTPWEVYSYDGNDNAGRTHPIISMIYQQCWNTPSSIVIDALGRTLQAVERNRDQQADGSWSPIIEYKTVSTYDIVGNLLTVADALGRGAFAYTYDLIKSALCTFSIDAGARTSVPDAAGNIVEERDPKGALILHSYDELNRPTRMWARDASGQTVTLREQIIYGDNLADSQLTEAQAVSANLLGKPYRHFDEAGLLTFNSYDFKGNLLDKTRNVITETALLSPFSPPPPDWAITPFLVDWSSADLSFLDTATAYQTTTSFDALNRVKTMQFPKDVEGGRKLLLPHYNRAGVLEAVQMDGTTYIEQIAYNAKGQRILVSYGNGFMTRYAYDVTFRLVRMRTEKYTKPSTTTYHPSSPAAPLQEFGYAYDLVGNVLTISDRAPGSGIQNSALGIDALNRNFVYDPVYRLISATGRECDLPPTAVPWTDAPRCTDITKVRAYTEAYQYDKVGNMALWAHTRANNRKFILTPSNNPLIPANNQLSQVSVGATPYKYIYDSNGNLIHENTDRHFEWDQSDRMHVFRIQSNGAPPSQYAQYLYDASGRRVMKLIRVQNGGYETTVYVDELFEHQRSVSSGGTVENNSLHVMDKRSRIAIVRVGDALPKDGAPNVKIKYQFADHLGSSNLVVDDSGNWISREEWLPYGETSFGSYARKRYRFTGKERDEESGLYYHGARYYCPYLARWTCCDPFPKSKKDTSTQKTGYGFVEDNPTRLIDPDGRDDNPAPAMAGAPLLAAGRAVGRWVPEVIEGGATGGGASGAGSIGGRGALALGSFGATALLVLGFSYWAYATQPRSAFHYEQMVEDVRDARPRPFVEPVPGDVTGVQFTGMQPIVDSRSRADRYQQEKFMADTLKTILAGCNGEPHPLASLVDPATRDWKSRTHEDEWGVQCGHSVSLASGLPFVLVLEDAFYNQLSNWKGENKWIRAVFDKPYVDICGVRVEGRTAEMYESSIPEVRKYLTQQNMSALTVAPLSDAKARDGGQ